MGPTKGCDSTYFWGPGRVQGFYIRPQKRRCFAWGWGASLSEHGKALSWLLRHSGRVDGAGWASAETARGFLNVSRVILEARTIPLTTCLYLAHDSQNTARACGSRWTWTA